MKTSRLAPMGLASALALALVSCADSGPEVRYQDPTAVETVTDEFGTTDVQLISEKMVGSLLETPVFGTDRPVIWVAPLRNKTSEHIDTKLVTNKIRTSLIKSGKVRFTAAADVKNELQEQLDYQNDPSVVDPRTAAARAKQIGAKFMLYGEISSIVKESGKSRLVDYTVTLNLTNVATGIIEWADDKTIRKGSTRRAVGP